MLRVAVRAREELLAVVAHDIRGALATMVTGLHVLRRHPEPVRCDQMLDVLQRAAQRMERLSEDLLDMAALEHGVLEVRPAPYPVRDLLTGALEAQQAVAAQRHQHLGAHLPAPGLRVRCDRDRVLQVLGNLIGNAIKFTPAGGVISLAVGATEQEVLFSVADTGPGIAADELPRIFDIYFQARRERASAGLGLFIAKRLIEAQGGRLWVESRQGAGASFFFTLPQAAS